MEGQIPLNSTWCKVKSVSGQECTVLIDDLEIEGILLGYEKSGVIVYPKNDTNVLVAFIDNTKTAGAVIIVEETDKIEIMGSANGGLVKSEKTAEQLNKIEQDVNSLKQIITAWSPIPNDGGAALKAAAATWAGQMLQTTNKTVLENPKVKHGEG